MVIQPIIDDMDDRILIINSQYSDEENILNSQDVITPVSLDITFQFLSYSIGKGNKRRQILHDLSGAFKCGQLTAIMGPSGAGKTSLMNILSGLKTKGVKGKVDIINGAERKMKFFHQNSAYVTYENNLSNNLTVEEYFLIAAHLKMGNKVEIQKKKSTIDHIVTMLRLNEKRQTRVCYLSGGERKRLSIGLELVNNPSMLFLDEPTSGLDSSSSMQCVSLLREISRSGRTVVATIHQPSSRLLDMFDHLYIVADGSCMYQGPVSSLVPFLQSQNLLCPSYHNPADFVMDVAAGEYGQVLAQLVASVENGRLIYREETVDSGSPTPIRSNHYITSVTSVHDSLSGDSDECVAMLRKKKKKKLKEKLEHFAAPFHIQVWILLLRTWKSIWREKMLTMLRFAAHIVVSIMIGLLYWRIGDDASVIYNNAGLLFFNQLFILFAAMMPTIVTFPLERDVLVREHLNHWYSLKAYYLAKTIADIPFQIVFPAVYLLTVYLMTNQPMDIERFAMLLGVTVATSLVAQGIGLLVGAAFSIPVAVFAGPAACIPFLLFSGFFVNLSAIPSYMSWIAWISYMRYSFEGSMVAIYGYNRPPLSCSQPYCHFRYSSKFMEQFDLADSCYLWPLIGLLTCFVVIRLAAYFVLRFKLRHVRA